MKRLFLLIFFLCFLGAGCKIPSREKHSRTAQVPPSPDPAATSLLKSAPLTLENALRIALLNNPDLACARAAAEAARMRYRRSFGNYLPQIRFQFGLEREPAHYNQLVNPIPKMDYDEKAFDLDLGFRADWLIFDGLVREFDLLSARAAAEKQQVNLADVRRLLRCGTAAAYGDVLMAMAQAEIYRSDRAFQQRNLHYAESRLHSGGASRSEVLNFRILAAAAAAKTVAAEYRIESARYALSALLGYPQGTLPPDTVFPELPQSAPPYDLDLTECLVRALSRRPDLAMAQYDESIAKYREYAAIGKFFPTVSAYIGTRYIREQSSYHNPGMGGSSLIAGWKGEYGLNVDYLLFSGGERYFALQESRALRAAVRAETDRKVLAVLEEVRSAYADYENLRKQIVIYGDMVSWVAEQRQLVQLEYDAGHVVITRLNEAQNDLIAAQSALVTTLASFLKARAALDAAIAHE